MLGGQENFHAICEPWFRFQRRMWIWIVVCVLRYGLNQIPYNYTVEVRNRFKGIDLIDRGPDELWMDVHDTLWETGIKTIPKKKKCKKAKWLSEEALQIAVKRREAKSKGEKERYTNLNAEFQRIARRDKKAFLKDLEGSGWEGDGRGDRDGEHM